MAKKSTKKVITEEKISNVSTSCCFRDNIYL